MDRELGALAVVLAFAVLWNVAGNLFVPDWLYVPSNLAAAALVVWVALRSGACAAELGLDRRHLTRGLRLGVIAVAVVAVVLAIALAMPSLESRLADEAVAADSPAMRWFRPLVRIPLGTVVAEELLFRSVLYGLVLRRRGPSAALWWSAGLFGLWHIIPAWETAQGTGLVVLGAVVGTVVATTAAGVLFGLLRRWSGSVVAPGLAHAATNSLAYVAALVALGLLG